MAKANKAKTLPKPGGEAPKADKALVQKVIDICKAFPHVKVIYVNEETGEYHFAPIPGFSPVDADKMREASVEDFEVSEPVKEPVKTDPPADPNKQEPPVTTPANEGGEATQGAANIEF